MIALNTLFELKIIKQSITKNFFVKDFKNPPSKDIQKDENGKSIFRKKTFIDKDGKKNILTFAIMKNKGKLGGLTKLTSKWKEK